MGYPNNAQRTTTQVDSGDVRVRLSGDQLGILPLVASAVPSVSQIAGKIVTSLVSIVDPGKKRDANREARAEMYYQYATAGSITAARRLYGGQTVQYTAKERQYYKDRWPKFAAAVPDLAAQAVALGLGPDGIPEPGSGTAPPQLSAVDSQQIQSEINAWHAAHAQAGTTPPGQPAIKVAAAGLGGLTDNPLVLGASLAAALFFGMKKGRR
jgi:hypothetical protein